jgi:hypothetical protein
VLTHYREKVFIETILTPLVKKLPSLKIVMEHITTLDAVNFIESCKTSKQLLSRYQEFPKMPLCHKEIKNYCTSEGLSNGSVATVRIMFIIMTSCVEVHLW